MSFPSIVIFNAVVPSLIPSTVITASLLFNCTVGLSTIATTLSFDLIVTLPDALTALTLNVTLLPFLTFNDELLIIMLLL